jgi:magnesium transporter
MRRELFSNGKFKWIDLAHPTAEELAQLQIEFHLHPTLLQDCFDPAHLPKLEQVGPVYFAIVRMFDNESKEDADTVQSMTRKIALFATSEFMITIHRLNPVQFEELSAVCIQEAFDPAKPENPFQMHVVLVKFLNRALRSFSAPIQHAENNMDIYETALFSRTFSIETLQGLHIIRRRLSLIKRILHHSQEMVHHLSPPGDGVSPIFQDLRENVATLLFHNDDLLEDVTSLLSLYITLASQKTNEVMRVLTVISVFFMPLNFIAGVYGMNFDNMPELKNPQGYPLVLMGMVSVTLVIAAWFYRKGWLTKI